MCQEEEQEQEGEKEGTWEDAERKKEGKKWKIQRMQIQYKIEINNVI